jgi:hypothetical protein
MNNWRSRCSAKKCHDNSSVSGVSCTLYHVFVSVNCCDSELVRTDHCIRSFHEDVENKILHCVKSRYDIIFNLFGAVVETTNLKRSVSRSKYILAAVILVTVGAYVFRFHDLLRTADPAAWGQFGDYIGGVLNPLIAFGAFYWLATSVLLQKTELEETRRQLHDSKLAQRDQADTALLTAKIQTLNIRLSRTSDKSNLAGTRYSQLLQDLGKEGPDQPFFNADGGTTSLGKVVLEAKAEVEFLAAEETVIHEEVAAVSAQFRSATYSTYAK